MDVSIVLVNYNTYSYLNDCIRSIRDKIHDVTYEIIIVDNASSDDSCRNIVENFPDVSLVSSGINLGFGKANNLGASIAKGDFLLLLNTDTIFLNNAIKILLDYMKSAPENVGMCCANLYRKDLSPNYSYALHFPSLLYFFCYRFHIPFFNESFNKTDRPKKVASIIGADMFLRKKVFELVGGFDECFFMYVEDTDLSYWINKAGYKAYNVPSAKILHLQGVSSSTLKKCKWEIDGYSYFFYKKGGKITKGIYSSIELLSALCRVLYFTVKGDRQMNSMYQEIVKYIFFKTSKQ